MHPGPINRGSKLLLILRRSCIGHPEQVTNGVAVRMPSLSAHREIMRLLLRGGRIIDPSQHIDEKMDLLIENGKIVKVAKNIIKQNSGRGYRLVNLKILDLHGKVVVRDSSICIPSPGTGIEYRDHSDRERRGCRRRFTAVLYAEYRSRQRQPVRHRIYHQSSRGKQLIHVYPVAAISRKSEGPRSLSSGFKGRRAVASPMTATGHDSA